MARIIIRVFEPAEWPLYRALRLRALTDAPDAFGSTLAREQAQPDEWWAGRLAAGATSDDDLPLLALVDGRPAGLTWARIFPADPTTANLYQMWVAPEARGLGVGQRLLVTAINWARERQASQMVLGVAWGNTPAVRLYTRAGFQPVGALEPLRPGSTVLAQAMQLALERPDEG